MKKIMILAVAAFVTVAAQAASVQWGSNRNGAKDYAGSTVYLIDGANYATVIAALTAGGADIATTFDSYVLDTATIAANGSSSGEATGVGNSIALFIFDSAIADGNTYVTTGTMDVSDYTYSGTEQSPGIAYFTSASFATEGSIGQAVPEPTSGLLLLLGVAGLALRRKVA